MQNHKRKAFTLAEVLITLGIIGVVAVLTVPNIVSNYQKKVYVAQLQKVYNQISNAVSLLMVDEEVDNLNETSLYCSEHTAYEDCIVHLGNFFKKYFKISKDCGYDEEDWSDCVAEHYKLINGELYGESFRDVLRCYDYCATINSGATICSSYPHNGGPFKVVVDINAKKKPNTFGRDTFAFSINYQGEIAESFGGYPNHLDAWHNNPERCLENESYGGGCFTKIINDGWKMDY